MLDRLPHGQWWFMSIESIVLFVLVVTITVVGPFLCFTKKKSPSKTPKAKKSDKSVKTIIFPVHFDSKKLNSANGQPPKEKGNSRKDAVKIPKPGSICETPQNTDKKEGDKKEKEDPEYPEVAEPTPSAKNRCERALQEDKKNKIQKGFYQSKSDEDDTLEPIKSLKEERTDDDVNQSTKKTTKQSSKKAKATNK